MISSLAWVPPGVASTTPTYADVPEEELEHLEARARAVVRRGRGRGDEDEEKGKKTKRPRTRRGSGEEASRWKVHAFPRVWNHPSCWHFPLKNALI